MTCPGWKRQLECTATVPTLPSAGAALGCTRWWFWAGLAIALFTGARKGRG